MTTKHVAYTITPTGILMFVAGKQFVVGNDHPNFSKVKTALKAKQHDLIEGLADIRQSVRNFISSDSKFELKNDLITLDGVSFSSAVTDKVLSMIDAGHNADPLYAFLRKVRNNPSKTAQDELLLFCVANGFMIHEDGDILAYKSVRADYTDIHSGRVRNAVGDKPTMARGGVDDNRERTCSSGFHFAAHQYATTWHGRQDARLMIMKIDPANVVSIPSDYGNQKARCCTYEVIAEIPHSSKLDKREVYSTSYVKSVDVTKPVVAVKPAIVPKKKASEKARKEGVIANLRAERSKLIKKGSRRSWQDEDSLDKINDRIAKIQDEIAAL
jgi:hypothetical protein